MDIDIDVPPGFDAIKLFPSGVRASTINKGELVKHPVGIYLQNMPKDEMTGLAAIPYTTAEQMGFFKFDFLTLQLLQHHRTKASVRELANQDPDWNLLRDKDVVKQLFHIGNHFDLINEVRPTSVQGLADCLALIRPSKRGLLAAYVRDPDATRTELYKAEDEYYFKRSHAIAYAMTIVIQMHALGTTAVKIDEMFEW